jgi:hypothetical protein
MMPIFSKLNLTTQKKILVLDAPVSFQEELAHLSDVEIANELKAVSSTQFVLIFVTQKIQVDQISPLIAKKMPGDVIVWFAYPKGTSKKYQCDFNRDNGWDVIKGLGFDTVRQVAIDADWSALRFRRNEFIGTR